MSRIFKQFGTGYASAPVSIIAQVDGTTVYSGTVPTVDGPVPDYIGPLANVHGEIFSWTEPAANTETRSLYISVTGGTLQLGQTLAQGNVANAAEYNIICVVTNGDEMYADPLTNVIIDGIEQFRPVDELPGQWNYNIQAGSILTATVTVNVFPTGKV